MNCMRTLLLAQELSSWRSAVPLQAASKRNLLRQWRKNCLQNSRLAPVRSIHQSAELGTAKLPVQRDPKHSKESTTRALEPVENVFERASKDGKTKAAFQKALELFCQQDVRRRGHIEFIYAAVKKMPEFGVQKDINVYNKILDVFPKDVFVPRNFIQRIFNHYPRQQECGVYVLDQMESYGVMPNKQTQFLLLQIFGDASHPIKKYQRMMYWIPKFRQLNPYPVPDPLPEDPVDLARLSLQRIAADLDAKVTVYQLPHEEILDSGKPISHPHIVGIQSPDQQSLLAQHNPERPLFVEGPFRLWLKNTCVYYYVLRAQLLPPEERKEEIIDPQRNFFYPMYLDIDLERFHWDDLEFDIDEVEEAPVFAMCMAGAGDQATLAKWIVGLEETNPILNQTLVVFRLTPGPQELQLNTDSDDEEKNEKTRSSDFEMRI
nr:evolutionarily conserved signaling intermediate in Toll pathway, mitochondrial [Pogona vitticeps]